MRWDGYGKSLQWEVHLQSSLSLFENGEREGRSEQWGQHELQYKNAS